MLRTRSYNNDTNNDDRRRYSNNKTSADAVFINVSKLRSVYMDLLNEIEVRRGGKGSLSTNDGTKISLKNKNNTTSHQKLNIVTKILLSKTIHPPMPPPEALRNAWLILSATGEGGGHRVSSSVRDDTTVAALRIAKECQTKLITILRSISEIVVFGEQNLHTNPAIFDYFCEKRMIALLVDIVRAKPIIIITPSASNFRSSPPPTILEDDDEEEYVQEERTGLVTNLMPVAYTSPVKAQVLQTISLLISNAKDPTSLYYLLSNNHINILLCSLLPLRQFTTASQEEIIPVFTGLLKNLTIHLVQSPSTLSQFFFLPHKKNKKKSTAKLQQLTTTITSFPLLSAAVEVAVSPYAKSDSFVRLTALNIIINICGLLDESIHALIDDCVVEQQHLFTHLCQGLMEQYRTIVSLVLTATGTSNDDSTTTATTAEVLNLLDQLHFINNLFQCGVRSLNVRLCEWILRYVVFDPLMQKIATSSSSSIHSNNKIIFTEQQVMAHVAAYFLSQMLLIVDYKPFSRMCAVAILHPLSPAAATASGKAIEASKNYAVTQALNDIVQGNHQDVSDLHPLLPVIKNKCREGLLRLLTGVDGDSSFFTAAMLVQTIIDSDAVSDALILKLGVLPTTMVIQGEEANEPSTTDGLAITKESKCNNLTASSHLEDSLHIFLSRMTKSYSAMKCAGSLAITLSRRILRGALQSQQTNKEADSFVNHWWDSSALLIGLRSALIKVAEKVSRFRYMAGLSSLFLEIMQAEVQRWYGSDNMKATQALVLSFRCSDEQSIMQSVDYLVRNYHDLSSDIEDAREAVRLFLLLRSLNSIFAEAKESWKNKPEAISPNTVHLLVRVRDTLINENIARIGGIDEVGPAIGTEVDLKGKTVFPFVSSWEELDEIRRSLNPTVRRHMGDIRYLRGEEQDNRNFLLVLDPVSIFVVKKVASSDDGSRGIIVCGCLLRNVIAAATENDWMHVIIRQGEDVGIPLDSGSMAFR
jgi:hypothetical protein